MTFRFLLLLSLGLCTITSIVTAIRTWTFDLTISRFQTLRPEGILVWVSGINNQFQGPDIIVSPGDRIIATVHNHLTNGTSIHWHAIRQSKSNNMDGVPLITQSEIAPGS